MTSSVSKNPRAWRVFLAMHGLASVVEGLTLTFLPLVVLQVTGSSELTAFVVVLRTLPVLIGAIPAGALADANLRARTLRIGNGVGAVGAMVLLVALMASDTLVTTALVLVATVILGFAQAAHTGVANTVPALLLHDADRPRGNSQVVMIGTVLGFILGPALGGLAGVVDLRLAALVLAVLYLILVGLTFALRLEEEEQGGAWKKISLKVRDLRTAGQALFSNSILISIVFVSVALNVAYGLVISVLPVYVTNVLGAPAYFFGIVVASGSVGSLVGTLIAPRIIKRAGWKAVLVWSAIGAALGYGAIAGVPAMAGIVAGYVVGSLSVVVWSIVSATLRQRLIPIEVFGRSVGMYMVLIIAATPLGALVATAFVGVSLSIPLYIAAALVIAGAISTFVLLRRETSEESSETASKEHA